MRTIVTISMIFIISVTLLSSCSKTEKNRQISVIKISAPGCDPCTNSEKPFSELKNEFAANIKFDNYDVNSPEGQMFIRNHSLKIIPTLLILNDMGMVLYRHEGAFNREQISTVLKNINNISKP
jgi:hypothetical protein